MNTQPATKTHKTQNKFWQTKLAQHHGRIIDFDKQLDFSYSDLNQKIDEFKHKIKGQRQLVALVADNSLNFVISYLSLLREKHVIVLREEDTKWLDS